MERAPKNEKLTEKELLRKIKQIDKVRSQTRELMSGSAIVAKTFGEGDREKGNQYFSLFAYTAGLLGILFAILGIAFLRPIAVLLGAEGDMLENAVLYGRIILLALPFNTLQFLFQSFFVTAEKPKMGLMVTIVSGFTNLVPDAALVLSLPQEYKLAGAAIATALNKNHPNTALHELHLNDSTVDLLKSGALNNRLLCESVCHPGFLRLLTDMEVCIDRIVKALRTRHESDKTTAELEIPAAD